MIHPDGRDGSQIWLRVGLPMNRHEGRQDDFDHSRERGGSMVDGGNEDEKCQKAKKLKGVGPGDVFVEWGFC